MITSRAKFKVKSVRYMDWDLGNSGKKGSEIEMSAICGTDGENASFAQNTPSGDIKFTLTNPDLAGVFQPGDVYYVDFTKTT